MLNKSSSDLRFNVHDSAGRSAPPEVDEEQLRTLWCGGLDEKCTEEILYELFLNAGPLERITIPKDKETKKQANYAFIVFDHKESVQFAYDLLNGTPLYKSNIRLQNKATGIGFDQRRGGMHQRSVSMPVPGGVPNNHLARRPPYQQQQQQQQHWRPEHDNRSMNSPSIPQQYPFSSPYGSPPVHAYGNSTPMRSRFDYQQNLQNGRDRDYRRDRNYGNEDRNRDYRERDRSYDMNRHYNSGYRR